MYSHGMPLIALPRRSQLGAANLPSHNPILPGAQTLRYV